MTEVLLKFLQARINSTAPGSSSEARGKAERLQESRGTGAGPSCGSRRLRSQQGRTPHGRGADRGLSLGIGRRSEGVRIHKIQLGRSRRITLGAGATAARRPRKAVQDVAWRRSHGRGCRGGAEGEEGRACSETVQQAFDGPHDEGAAPATVNDYEFCGADIHDVTLKAQGGQGCDPRRISVLLAPHGIWAKVVAPEQVVVWIGASWRKAGGGR